jgi:hypothetical protein
VAKPPEVLDAQHDRIGWRANVALLGNLTDGALDAERDSLRSTEQSLMAGAVAGLRNIHPKAAVMTKTNRAIWMTRALAYEGFLTSIIFIPMGYLQYGLDDGHDVEH